MMTGNGIVPHASLRKQAREGTCSRWKKTIKGDEFGQS